MIKLLRKLIPTKRLLSLLMILTMLLSTATISCGEIRKEVNPDTGVVEVVMSEEDYLELINKIKYLTEVLDKTKGDFAAYREASEQIQDSLEEYNDSLLRQNRTLTGEVTQLKLELYRAKRHGFDGYALAVGGAIVLFIILAR